MKKRNKKSGFTLVELMVVAAIIAILAAIIIPLMSQNKVAGVAAEGQNILGAMMTAAKAHYARTGVWPATLGALGDAELSTDAANTKNWSITDATSFGAKAPLARIQITCDTAVNGFAGTLALEKDWEVDRWGS